MGVRAVDASAMAPETVAQSLATISAGLRQADRDEVSAATGGAPGAILKQSFELSTRAWFILDREDDPIAVFGVAPTASPGVGVVWMLGTDGVEREWVGVARQTRRYLSEMHEQFNTLWNFIDARNVVSLEWLLWSGFHIIDADPSYGVEGRMFYEFARVG